MKTNHHLFSPEETFRRIEALANAFPFAQQILVGKSLCQRPISALSLGCGRKTLLFVGAHHGSEAITSALLLDFAEELCRAADAGERRFGFTVRDLLECRRLILLPSVNPDGVAIAQQKKPSDDPFGRKLLAMNGGSEDFSRWQANARGVDINHNYNHRFCEYKRLEKENGIRAGRSRYAGEYPESEPETAAVCRLVESLGKRLSVILTFHSQGRVIYYHDSPKTRQGAFFLARSSGYTLEKADGLAAYGGLSDWANEIGIPSYTIEIGKGENPLAPSLLPSLYATLRETLFTSLAFF